MLFVLTAFWRFPAVSVVLALEFSDLTAAGEQSSGGSVVSRFFAFTNKPQQKFFMPGDLFQAVK